MPRRPGVGMVEARPPDFHSELSWPAALYVVLRIRKLLMEPDRRQSIASRLPLAPDLQGQALGFNKSLRLANGLCVAAGSDWIPAFAGMTDIF